MKPRSKDRYLSARVTQDHMRRVTEASKSLGMTRGEVMRRLIARYTDLLVKEYWDKGGKGWVS